MSEGDRTDLARMLGGGDRRSIGRSREAAALATEDLATRMELVRLLETADPLMRMRAADALEKVTRADPGLLKVFRGVFLRMAAMEQQPEVRWHLAQMLPRFSLSDDERMQAIEALRGYLSDGSAIVQAWALNGIAQIAHDDQRFKALAAKLIADAAQSPHPSVRARARSISGARARGGERKHG